MATAEEAAVSTPQTSCSSRSLRPKQPLQVLTGAPRRGLEQLVPMPSPCPTQDMVDDAYIRNINDLSLQLKNRDPEQVRTICQRRHHLNNRPVPEPEMVGQGEGARGPPQTEPHIVSARWHSFHGNLLRYQRQLEEALEMHTLSLELDAVTEQIGEKVNSQSTNTARGRALPVESPMCPAPCPSHLFRVGTWRSCQGCVRGAPGALRINYRPQRPPLQAQSPAHLHPFAPRSIVVPEARACHPQFPLLSLSKP